MVVGPSVLSRTEGEETAQRPYPRVLLIDRQMLFLAALGRLLTSPPLNAVVISSNRSDDAVDVTAQQPIDLVVCDARAERLPGAEVARALAGRRPLVRVILMAEGGDESVLVESLLSGASGFFTKDTEVQEFTQGVQAVLEGRYTVGRNLLGETLNRFAGAVKGVHPQPGRLSPSERGILILLGEGKTVREIARERDISQKTVLNHLANIYRKLGLRNRTEAILWAVRNGLISADNPYPDPPPPAREGN